MTRNPRTRTLLKLTGGDAIRLLPADRTFLQDLARVGLISDRSASTCHYTHLKNGAGRSLERLKCAGLIRGSWLHARGERHQIFSFASREIARAWGGELPVIGNTRSVFHEWVVSRLYFELDRPQDFRIAAAFSVNDKKLCGETRPDAMYTNADGEVVFVEADSGHYTRKQINTKMNRWQGMQQVWGQPAAAFAPITGRPDVTVIQV